jgi:hypothetical protein
MTKLSEIHLAECDRKKKYCLCDLDHARNEGQESIWKEHINCVEEQREKGFIEGILKSENKKEMKNMHEHIWQFHPNGFYNNKATFYCHCGKFKEVELEALKSKEVKKA